MSMHKVNDSEDTRVDCKYGVDCFQKNPEHHKKYKHPPNNKKNSVEETGGNKKRKSSESEESSSSDLSTNKKQNISLNSEPILNTKIKSTHVESTDKDEYNEIGLLIYKIFLVPMPKDFYQFYDFCKELKPSDPSTAFQTADITLVGPYDVLNGRIDESISDQSDLLTHWRYYYDPPEFQTILKGNDKDGLHFGYWRDRPSSEPTFVAENCCNIDYKIKSVAENVFGAIASYLEEKLKKANPFEKTGISNLLGKLKTYAKKNSITLETQTSKMKLREKNVVARTIHGAGIVCPYNKKTQLGYRELSVTDNQLIKIVKKIDEAKNDEERVDARTELGEVVRLATIAGDECDFGTCLELGHDLLSTGSPHVQNAALMILSTAYNQLDRQEFLKIVRVHMKNRKNVCNTSALNNTS